MNATVTPSGETSAGIGRTHAVRQPHPVAGFWRDRLEVALQADLRRKFDLVEHNRRPGKRHAIDRGIAWRSPGASAVYWIERHQRRKTVGIDGRVVDSTMRANRGPDTVNP